MPSLLIRNSIYNQNLPVTYVLLQALWNNMYGQYIAGRKERWITRVETHVRGETNTAVLLSAGVAVCNWFVHVPRMYLDVWSTGGGRKLWHASYNRQYLQIIYPRVKNKPHCIEVQVNVSLWLIKRHTMKMLEGVEEYLRVY
jgi:hypothetical protein